MSSAVSSENSNTPSAFVNYQSAKEDATLSRVQKEPVDFVPQRSNSMMIEDVVRKVAEMERSHRRTEWMLKSCFYVLVFTFVLLILVTLLVAYMVFRHPHRVARWLGLRSVWDPMGGQVRRTIVVQSKARPIRFLNAKDKSNVDIDTQSEPDLSGQHLLVEEEYSYEPMSLPVIHEEKVSDVVIESADTTDHDGSDDLEPANDFIFSDPTVNKETLAINDHLPRLPTDA